MHSNEMEKLQKLASAIPKQKNLAIFFGRAGSHFMDNVKYFYIHCVKNQPELECHFMAFEKKDADILKSQGLPATWVNHPDSADLMAKAGIVISDDFSWKDQSVLWALLSEAKTVQLWHGIPLKAIGFPEINSTVNMNPEKAKHLTFAYSGYDTVVSTSPFFTERAFAKAFRAEKFIESGYPRNDVLMRRPTKYDMINTDRDLYGELVKFRKLGGKTVFFMPTFRDTGGGPFEDGAIDLMRMSKFCRKNNLMFVCKFHPYLTLSNVSLPENIRLVDSKSDVYPLLPLCDVLLTDYSSVYFDFLLVDNPIVFYPYDYKKYISKNRELLFDYDSMTPGKKVTNENDLYTAFEDIMINNIDDFADVRHELRNLSFSNADGLAAKRLGKHVVSNFL
ncbi:CDP-glycerol glycerophosphotransferase family protein [Desulfovibrio gilichinskyi]|uniref:CDP-glycerol glycerophosphotransferase n=1 Tax=Desulfovibrio gilichinskyi TaxID=1519643 RepID=A0A1X7F2Q1_9BACT|nr:CDP-glycerol glycerophosphotransferase family protein [Desulfovibrio gilichinskyi]SMF44887.1 CDP-glycerol glycerophosphotransferase [Desulfovibrio gilichinskyi]